MADVIMPQMGESIAEGTVTKWLKNVGDRIERDEPLFEISTDKVDAEIPSPAAGILTEIRVGPGTTVPIHTAVGVVPAEAEATASAQPAAAAATPPAPAAEAALPAQAAASVGAVTLPPLPPPVEYHIEGERLPQAGAADAAPLEKPRAEMTPEELRITRSSPVVRKIAAEHQLDIREIPGTGIGGRVTKHDILGHIEGRPTPPPAVKPAVPAAGPRLQVVPMSPIRKKTAEHMVLSKRTSAHVSTVFEIDFTRIDQLRHKHRASFEERGVKLSYMPFVLKAVVDALAVFPVLNASIDGDNVVYRKDVNLGIAVALEWGLIVPVIHHADEKNVLGLARATADLAERARAKKLKVEEVQGGTFTITNPGVFGSPFGPPTTNQPAVGILGPGPIEKRPVGADRAIGIRTMAYVALTFDHRLVDGADADRFMAHIKKTLQEFDETSL